MSIQRFADQSNVSIVKRNIGVLSTEQETIDRVTGLEVAVQNEPGGLANITISNEIDIEEVSAVVTMKPSFFEVLRNTSNDKNEKQRLIFVTYEQNCPLFLNEETNSTGSVVVTLLRSPEQGTPPKNLDEPIRIIFKVDLVSTYDSMTVVCTYVACKKCPYSIPRGGQHLLCQGVHYIAEGQVHPQYKLRTHSSPLNSKDKQSMSKMCLYIG